MALVTGANRGTGLAIAEELDRRGYRVLALNRSLRKESWLREFEVDLADSDAVRQAVAEAVAHAGRLDVCVANAAFRHLAPVGQMAGADWDRAVAVNLTSVFVLVQAALPALRRSRGSCVVMGSHAGTRYFEGGAAYSATKAALKALVETLLLEERRYGVRTTLVSPGAIANQDGDADPLKMTPAAVARCVADVLQAADTGVVVGEVELRPGLLPPPNVYGIERLRYV